MHCPQIIHFNSMTRSQHICRQVGFIALLGKIEQFDSQQEEWPQCMERMEELFEVNDLTRDNKAAKRQPIFLAVIGLEPFELLEASSLP